METTELRGPRLQSGEFYASQEAFPQKAKKRAKEKFIYVVEKGKRATRTLYDLTEPKKFTHEEPALNQLRGPRLQSGEFYASQEAFPQKAKRRAETTLINMRARKEYTKNVISEVSKNTLKKAKTLVESKKVVNPKLAEIVTGGILATAAISGVDNPSHELIPQNIGNFQTEAQSFFDNSQKDNVTQQSKKQADLAEQDEKKKKAEQKKATQSSKNKIVSALAKEADKESPTSRKDLKKNIALIVDSLKERKIATPRVIAYAMATMETETGHTYKPVREAYYLDKANGEAPGTNGQRAAIANGYEGGKNYYGRGYIQITHDYNYQKFDKELDLNGKLANNPNKALKPEIAGDILAEFFKENGVAKLAEKSFTAAREPINSGDKVGVIANDAKKYLNAINE